MAGASQGYALNIFEQAVDWDSVAELGFIGTAAGEVFGNSYISAFSWDESDCPDAYSILTYSQSSDLTTAHYADATALYSKVGWIDMPFSTVDIEAQELSREVVQA
jgi:acyl-homoserine lactone acylase PvdQ